MTLVLVALMIGYIATLAAILLVPPWLFERRDRKAWGRSVDAMFDGHQRRWDRMMEEVRKRAAEEAP